MTKKSLSHFKEWRGSAKNNLVAMGYNVEIFDAPESWNNSSTMYFRNNSVNAAIMFWEYGEIHAEAEYLPTSEFIKICRIDEEQNDLETVLNHYLLQITKYCNKA